MAEFSIQEIIPGIQVAFGGICNRGIINGDGHFLVVDSGFNSGEARPLRAAVDEQRKDGTLSLFNTHPHADHVFGNHFFADVSIIAQQNVRENMLKTAAPALKNMQQNPEGGAAFSDTVITLPTVTFEETLTLYLGETEVQLIHYGVAHSPSDSVAWLPQTKTLFTGDLLFNDRVPAMPPAGSATNWVQALLRLEHLGAEHVIPGHGSVKSPAALAEFRVWIEELLKQVHSALESGLDRDGAMASIPAHMQAFQPRDLGERIGGVVGAVYDQLTQK